MLFCAAMNMIVEDNDCVLPETLKNSGRFKLVDSLTGEEYPVVLATGVMNASPAFFKLPPHLIEPDQTEFATEILDSADPFDEAGSIEI
jgi:hypothetical protein